MQPKAPEKKTPRPPRQFTPEFRAGAVRLVMEEGRSQALVAKDLGIAKSVIARWVKEARTEAGQGPPGAVTSSERDELARLRKENKVLRMEREILKKAAAFFAKENG